MRALFLVVLLGGVVFAEGPGDDPADYYWFPAGRASVMVDRAIALGPPNNAWLLVLRKQMGEWKKENRPGDPMPWLKESFDDFRQTFPGIVGW